MSDSCSNGQSTALLGALGSLIGFIATGLPVDDLFERQLWPQRFFNHLSWSEGVKIALLLPMGGPLYQVAFRTLDCLYRNELFSGTSCGHMLGTPFFPDNNIMATIYDESGKIRNTRPVRNCLWIRVLRNIAINSVSLAAQKSGTSRQVLRARTSVTFLELSYTHHEPPVDAIVDHDTGRITLKCVFSTVLAEITGIITAIVVVIAWRSVFAIIWLLPLLLRLLSITFVVPREGLPSNPCSVANPVLKATPPEVLKVEIHTPVDGFLVIQGPSDAVFPFTRHYGHPVRNKVRESVQIGVIIGFGLLFPLGLLCSLLWMQEGLQYMWLGYQMYSIIALYVYRYAGGRHWATTESRIAKLLSDSHEQPREIFLKDINGMLKARMSRTILGSQAEGRKAVQFLISVGEDGSTAS